ncbi:ChaN family lipoprotein [Chitinivorax sp. B]|uniref:ChaN family lipoprotein n=1 Tax=Chitinivorax sp. B TaxID=2502235 RepID=UPI0010F89648|nr:ChaN family lipoprotein [Chitinivorax sp. B]
MLKPLMIGLASLLTLAGCQHIPLSPPASIVLLGEVHDHPQGHQERLSLLMQYINAGWRPVLVMEQFDRERQPQLDQAMQQCGDADCVIQAAGSTRWEWPYYKPVIAMALQYHLPILAANVSRNDAGRIMRDGFAAALDASTRQHYQLDVPLASDLVEQQQQAIMQGHCNALPVTVARKMVDAQVARDVWMAKLLSEHASQGAVLLAGNGHVQRGIGVPRWLKMTRQDFQSIGFIETSQADMTSYDRVIHLPTHARPDPCQAVPKA